MTVVSPREARQQTACDGGAVRTAPLRYAAPHGTAMESGTGIFVLS